MPKDPKVMAPSELPKDLPLPKYEYQKVSSGTGSAPYRKRADEADSARKQVCLQNVTFA